MVDLLRQYWLERGLWPPVASPRNPSPVRQTRLLRRMRPVLERGSQLGSPNRRLVTWCLGASSRRMLAEIGTSLPRETHDMTGSWLGGCGGSISGL
jgi:hypothetical protein